MNTEEKFQAFQQYIGSRAIVNIDGIRDNEVGVIVAASLRRNAIQVVFDGQPIIGDDDNWCTIEEHCSLILTPMSELTEEHALHIAKIVLPVDWIMDRKANDGFFTQFTCDYNGVKGQRWISINQYCEIAYEVRIFDKGVIDKGHPFRYVNHPVPYIEIIDYLRSKGYAVPYMGNDLFKAGVAIKKSEEKTLATNSK